MLNIKSLILVLFTIIFLLSACNSEDIVAPQLQKQLIKIIVGSDNYSTFSYQNSLLTKYESVNNSQLFTSVSFDYDSINRVISAVEKINIFEYLNTYIYDTNNRIEKILSSIKDSSSNYVPSGYVKYFYDNSGNLAREEEHNSQDELITKTEFKYDANGNVVKNFVCRDNTLYATMTSTYDNKIYPWYNLRTSLIYPVSLSKNNATYTSIVYENGNQGNNRVQRYLFV
ncbi:hypothetical protein BMS3Abin03_01586 [bacterium BMS3Abin03]|nr:hypothetical protein BMS3Abin03_01586 [bacterium BMS3Abin03]